MAASDDLFQLIKSLQPNEKRYFKVFASRFSNVDEANHYTLFEAIEELEEYDEEKLKKKLQRKKKNTMIAKYLSAEKKALHELIMRSMRSFHAEKTVDVQLNELLTDEQFYHDKSLYDLQAKTLMKAKKLAQEYEKFPVLLTVLQREAKMLLERKSKELEEVRERVHKEEIAGLEKLVNESELRQQKLDIFIDHRLGMDMRQEAVRKLLEEKMKNPLLQSEERALSFHAKKHYYDTFRMYYRMTSDFKKSWEFAKKITELYELNTALREEYSFEYKIALVNYLGACHSTQNYDEFARVLEKLKKLPLKSLDEEGEVFQDVALYEVLYYINTGKYNEAVKVIPDIEKGMKKYAAKLIKSVELTIYYNISILYFILQDWKGFLHWLNKIIDDKSDSRKDIQHFARILQLLAYYETGKSDMMEYFTRSVYRYLEKEGGLMDFERMMLNYLKKFPFALTQKELVESFKKLKTDIAELRKQGLGGSGLGMEEMNIWLTAKIEDRTIADVMKDEG